LILRKASGGDERFHDLHLRSADILPQGQTVQIEKWYWKIVSEMPNDELRCFSF
jgi:hypothetical protein